MPIMSEALEVHQILKTFLRTDEASWMRGENVFKITRATPVALTQLTLPHNGTLFLSTESQAEEIYLDETGHPFKTNLRHKFLLLRQTHCE